MNGRAAKADRRYNRTMELVLQAHDRLHKDDVDGCHRLLHRALGVTEATSPATTEPLAHRLPFDAAFRRLCQEKGVRASYVLIDGVDAGGMARLLSGGDAEIDGIVTKAVRAAG